MPGRSACDSSFSTAAADGATYPLSPPPPSPPSWLAVAVCCFLAVSCAAVADANWFAASAAAFSSGVGSTLNSRYTTLASKLPVSRSRFNAAIASSTTVTVSPPTARIRAPTGTPLASAYMHVCEDKIESREECNAEQNEKHKSDALPARSPHPTLSHTHTLSHISFPRGIYIHVCLTMLGAAPLQ